MSIVFTPKYKSLLALCAVTLYVVTLSGSLKVTVATPFEFVHIVSKCAVSSKLARMPSPPPPPPPFKFINVIMVC